MLIKYSPADNDLPHPFNLLNPMKDISKALREHQNSQCPPGFVCELWKTLNNQDWPWVDPSCIRSMSGTQDYDVDTVAY